MHSIRRQLVQTQTFSWAITGLLGVLVAVGIVRQTTFTQNGLELERTLTQIELVQYGLSNLSSGVQRYALTGAETDLENIGRARGEANRELAALSAKISPTDENLDRHREVVKKVRSILETWLREYAEPVIAARRLGADQSVQAVVDAQGIDNVLSEAMRADLESYRSDLQNSLQNLEGQAQRESRALVWLTAIWVLGALIPSMFGWFLATRRISGSLERLAEGAKRLADGDLSVRVNEPGPLEVGRLAGAFNDLADQLELSQADLEARNMELRRYAENLERSAMFERSVSQALKVFTSSYDRSHTLSEVLHLLAEHHGFEIGAIYHFEKPSNHFELAATRGLVRELGSRFRLEESIVGQAVLDRRTIQLEDAPIFQMHTGLGVANAKFTVIVPVHYQDRIVGAMVLAHSIKPDPATLAFLEQLGQQLGITLQNLEQYGNLQRLSMQLQERQLEIEIKNRDLERADRLKTEFLANMSHELRTPLNAVIGFSQLLEQQFYGPLNDKQLEYIQEIENAGEHLLELINDILDLSKIEAGRMELEADAVELVPMLESCVRLVKERAARAGLELALETAGDVNIIGDARKLKQIVVNLLSNAVKFTPSGGKVSLRAHPLRRKREALESLEGDVEISVTDTGIGISQDDQERLFTPFTQVDGSLARRHEGTGLGLALTKRLVELHGGTIRVNSTPGQGSTFIVRLPATPPSVPPIPTEESLVTLEPFVARDTDISTPRP